MAILGKLLQQGIKVRKSIEQANTSPLDLQREELFELLSKARKTQFGKKYRFNMILQKLINEGESKTFYKAFKEQLPVYNYNKIYNEWWYKTKAGDRDVCWPGTVKYFALSSGTSEASTKHIPITGEMIKAIRRTGIRQILTLSDYDLSPEVFTKGILMLGGSTHLNYSGHYFEGDLSGITAGQIPFWFQFFYKPGKKI
ncbi:MAG TPA: GH3 auxin-responsive promoter family protein, partial [Cytophagales bacterium]|nr:GH3 auxin-responsive promoter family protein [Cytophagales bacterium]